MTAAPLLLVLAYRPEYLHAWAAKAQHAEITVGRLGGASSAAMVRAILSKPYAGRVALVPFSAQQSETMLAHLLGTETVSPELEAVVARASRAGMRFYLGSAERLLGEVTGDPAHFERAIAVLAEIGAENELALALAGRGRRLGQHGDPSGARRDLTRALEIFERLGTLEEPERTREELAALGPT